MAEGTGTSGMPQPHHFPAIARAGFGTVINLALPTSDNALPNEADLVTREGMSYIHIPVLFDAPKTADFDKFRAAMNPANAKPVFVHCAANMRVSAFMFLYRLHQKTASRAQAEKDLLQIWEPDPVWRKFINKNLPAGEPPL